MQMPAQTTAQPKPKFVLPPLSETAFEGFQFQSGVTLLEHLRRYNEGVTKKDASKAGEYLWGILSLILDGIGLEKGWIVEGENGDHNHSRATMEKLTKDTVIGGDALPESFFTVQFKQAEGYL